MERRRKSKYDPYIREICVMLDGGCTYQQIADELFRKGLFGSDKDSLYHFCRKNELQSRVTMGSHTADIPHCDECVRCIEVTNTTGHEERLCVELLRIVARSCKTSPVDCPKRERRSG